MALKLCVLLILILGTKSGYETSSDNFSEENGREHVISPDTTKDIMLQSTFGKSWADPEEDLGSDLRILNGGVEPTKADISKIDLTKSAKSGIQTVSLVSMDREQLSVKAESSVPMEKEQVPSITEQLFVKTVTLTKEADDATLKKEEANNSGKTEKATLDNNLETDVKNIAALKGDSEVTTLNDFSKTQMTYSGDVLIVGTNINQSVKNQDTMAPEVAMHARKTWSILGHMVWQVLERYVRTCHFIAMTSYLNEGILPEVLRYSSEEFRPSTVINLRRTSGRNESFSGNGNVWGSVTTSCRVLLLDLTVNEAADDLFEFLEDLELWLYPFTKVITVGAKSSVNKVFNTISLRNSLNVAYLALPDEFLQKIKIDSTLFRQVSRKTQRLNTANVGVISVFNRCFFCQRRDSKAKRLFLWHFGSNLSQGLNIFPGQLQNMHGYQFRIVSVTYFPFMDYTLDSNSSASTVTPLDSLDFRMLKIFSKKLNFTYEIRAPWDMQWGNPIGNGNWTGIVGTLQHNKADFSTVMAPNSARLAVLGHARAYTADTLVVTSLKPQPLTQYLLVVRPFTADVWIGLVVSILVWSASLWILQKLWFLIFGGRSKNLLTSNFYSLGILLEDIPSDPPTNLTGQMMVGWWLLFCLIITNSFRSSLVAHLTVQTMTPPIESLQDLVNKDHWSWGIELKMLQGAALNFFKSSTDPVVQEVYQKLEIVGQADGLQRILKGGFSFLSWSLTIKTEIDSYHTDDFGNTPYYTGKKGSPMLTDFGWGFRRGAAFQRHFGQMMNRLIEAGILGKWKEQIMTSRVKQIRENIRVREQPEYDDITYQQTRDQVPLRIDHLQGVFLLMAVGYGIAFIILLCEKLAYKYKKTKLTKGTM